jgi:hypothetical protein
VMERHPVARQLHVHGRIATDANTDLLAGTTNLRKWERSAAINAGHDVNCQSSGNGLRDRGCHRAHVVTRANAGFEKTARGWLAMISPAWAPVTARVASPNVVVGLDTDTMTSRPSSVIGNLMAEETTAQVEPPDE